MKGIKDSATFELLWQRRRKLSAANKPPFWRHANNLFENPKVVDDFDFLIRLLRKEIDLPWSNILKRIEKRKEEYISRHK